MSEVEKAKIMVNRDIMLNSALDPEERIKLLKTEINNKKALLKHLERLRDELNKTISDMKEGNYEEK